MSALRRALDALAAGGPDAAVRLAAFQAQLLNSEAHAVVGVRDGAVVGSRLDGFETRLALAAAAGGVVVEGNGAAAALGSADGATAIALHRLGQPTPLAQALARERLELTLAIARAHESHADAAFDAALLAFAAASWDAAQLDGLAALLAGRCGAGRLAIALVRRARVIAVADTASPVLAAEARRRLELAAGELIDAGQLLTDAETTAFTGLDRVADGVPVRGVTQLSGAGDGIVALAWPPADTARLLALLVRTAPAVVARLQRPSAGERFNRLGSRLPWPAGFDAGQRARLARRGVAMLLAVVLLLPLPDPVRAPLTIEPLLRRAVTAPLAARIDAVHVEPGDRVAAGTVLVDLDTTATAREAEDTQATLQQAAGAASAASAEGDVEAERIAQLKVMQATAQLATLQARLADAAIRAPIAGTVTGDDLRRRVGAGVNRGELLFMIAGDGGYRAELRVADSDIDRVRIGAPVRLALSALPLSRPRGQVTRIYPIAEVDGGRNSFRVIAALDRPGDLRGGMAGTASVSSGWAPLAWQLLRVPWRWLRLKLWV